MALRLTIVSAHGPKLGTRSVKEFGPDGGTIGRSLQCNWVLPDTKRYLSSRHASIDFRSGSYYIVDTSTNGVYVNNAEQPVGRGTPQRLFDGDRLRIGEYVMSVEIDEDPIAPLIDENHVDPVDLAQRVEAPEPTGDDMVDAYEITGVGIEMMLTDDELETLKAPVKSKGAYFEIVDDDLAAKTRGSREAGSAAARPFGSSPPSGSSPGAQGLATRAPAQASAAARAEASPAPRATERKAIAASATGPAEGAGALRQRQAASMPPAGSMSGAAKTVPAARPAAPQPAMSSSTAAASKPAAAASPAASNRTPTATASAAAAPPAPAAANHTLAATGAPGAVPATSPGAAQSPPAVAAKPAAPIPAAAAKGATRAAAPSPAAPGAKAAPVSAERLLATKPQTGAPARAAAAQPTPLHAARAADLEPFFRGLRISARVPPQQVDAFLFRLGQVMRAMIVGVTESLHLRAEQKNALKLSSTTIQLQDNNPLKLSAGVEEAVANLLLRDSAAHLAPVDAVREAFDDLQLHQQVLLKATRAALDAFISRLDPEDLEQKFSRGRGNVFVNAANRLKYWDFYKDLYDVVAHHPPGELPIQFLEDFAQAYEHELEHARNGTEAAGQERQAS